MTASVTLRYVNCDPSAESPNSFMSLLVSHALNRPVQIVRAQGIRVDLQFTSVQIPLRDKAAYLRGRLLERVTRGRLSKRDHRWDMQNAVPSGRAGAHIWYTGENVRPPLGDWDGYFSFDLDPLAGKNVYLPLWWHSVGVLGSPQSHFMTPAPRLESLQESRSINAMPDGFAMAIVNNPHPMRLHAINSLRRFGEVDVFGGAVGRPIANKSELAGRYRYSVCFENDLYPGYVTEKAIEAWSLGTIPLWWGLDPGGYLNKEALFNAAEFAELADMAYAAAGLCQDKEGWCHKASLPLLSVTPNLDQAIALIRALV